MGSAATAAAWALALILEACTVTAVDHERFPRLGQTITEAGEDLAAARDHLQGIHDLAAALTAVVIASEAG